MTVQDRTAPAVVALADDLSGAAEAAVALTGPGRASSTVAQVVLGNIAVGTAAVQVLDLDHRGCSAEAASERVSAALTRLMPTAHSAQDGPLLFVKIDSQLRGNVAAGVQALVAAGHVPVVAPSLPVAGRTVVGGVLLVDDRPLSTTASWRGEAKAAPSTVADALGVPAVVTSSPRAELLSRAAHVRGALVVDAVTDADLDDVVAAFAREPGAVLVGSAGLAAALGRTLLLVAGVPTAALPVERVLVVVGTAEPVARRQVDALPEAIPVIEVTACTPDLEQQVRTALRSGTTVVRSLPLQGRRTAQTSRLLAGLTARTVGADPSTALVLLGGETARRTCDALGVDVLLPRHQVHHGAVVCTAPDGRTIVVRPGSFGDDDSLREVLTALRRTASVVGPLLREALT